MASAAIKNADASPGGKGDFMKTFAVSAIVLSTVLGFASGAQAQQAKKLFFEGDIVRHALADQAGPFCVLANQFKRKEAVAWRIRVLEPNGNVADNKVLKSVVVVLGNGQKIRPITDRMGCRRPIISGPSTGRFRPTSRPDRWATK